MAMTMLNVGLLAVVAAFTSGIWGISRAGSISTASALGDAQMELYRGLPNACIYMPSPPSSGTYASDGAYSTQYQVTTGTPPSGTSCTTYGITPPANAIKPHQLPVLGPDHHNYEIDTYINYRCTDLTVPTASVPPCPVSTPEVTLVTVVVRNGLTPSKILGRQTSLFSSSTG